jgi:1-acyl-sn-glycerol-3-phosphate acyltransferase
MLSTKINIQCPTCKLILNKNSYVEPYVCMPCGHMVHEECIQSMCGICNNSVTKCIPKSKLDKSSQYFHDANSISRTKLTFTICDRLVGINRLFSLCYMVFKFYAKSVIDLIFGSAFVDDEYLLSKLIEIKELLNINVNVHNKNKLISDGSKRILICNHTNYHDFIIMASLNVGKIGFVAGPTINTFAIGRAITKIWPCVMVGSSSEESRKGGFDKIKEFMESNEEGHDRLIICPEGRLTHSSNIIRFRTSAFKLNYLIQPIVFVYKHDVFSLKGFDMLCQPFVDVDVHICDSIQCDGNDESIEKIRENMANVGNLKLSRVENRFFHGKDI